MDGRPLVGRRTGIGRYVFEICRELDSILPDAEFFVYAPRPVELPVASSRWHSRLEHHGWARNLKPIAWLKLRAGRLCREDRLDAFWATATLFPRLPDTVRRISTVYDLTFRLAPETMGRTHLLAQRLFFRRDVRRAHQLVAISHGSAARLQSWLGGPLAAVAPPAASPTFRPGEPTTVARTLAGFGIKTPYFLGVGTWEPRKNLELLVRVFRALQEEGEFRNYKLVLAGGPGWKDQRFRDLLGVGDSPDRMTITGAVMALGYVSDDQLVHLYTGCRAFVFPSRYEGFGLPVLEARACGAAVVASDLPEIREAGDDASIYVPPTTEGLRDGLRRVVAATPAPRLGPHSLPTWRDSASVLARYLVAV